MRAVSRLRVAQAVVAAAVAALALAALASLGATVAPASSPAAAQAYPKRVTICHRSGRLKRSKYRTIRVAPRALRGHLKHGDGLGPCSRARFTICHKTKGGKHRTIKVKGAKAHRKHMKHGDKPGACKKKKKKKLKH
jgi:hypothetical protein